MEYQERLNFVNDCIWENNQVRDRIYELLEHVNHLSIVFDRVYLDKMSLSSDLQGMICNNTTDGVVEVIGNMRRDHYKNMSNLIQECRDLIDVEISNLDIQIIDDCNKRDYYQQLIESEEYESDEDED